MVVATARKYTYEDYINTPEDTRYELIDGELIELAAAANRAHQKAVTKLGSGTNLFVSERDLGVVYVAPRDVVFADGSIVQPDVLFIAKERLHIDTDAEIWGAPDLVVEVLSPSTERRDKTVKRALYERHGVKEHWLVDTDEFTVTVFLLGEFGFEAAAVYGYDDTLISPTLPGFSMALSEVF